MTNEEKYIIEVLDFLKYQVSNHKCSEQEMKSIHHTLSNSLDIRATAEDLSEFYGQSPNNVRNVISRRPVAGKNKPVRRVMYSFQWFSKLVPKSWLK